MSNDHDMKEDEEMNLSSSMEDLHLGSSNVSSSPNVTHTSSISTSTVTDDFIDERVFDEAVQVVNLVNRLNPTERAEVLRRVQEAGAALRDLAQLMHEVNETADEVAPIVVKRQRSGRGSHPRDEADQVQRHRPF